MKKIVLSLWLCAVALLSSAQVADFTLPGQYIIHLQGGIDCEAFLKANYDATAIQCLSASMNIWLIQSEEKGILDRLKSDKQIIAAQYNHNNVTRRSLVPNDTYFADQWNMQNLTHPGADISAPQAWDINHNAVTRTGDTIVIAVIDDPFDVYHEDVNFFVNRQEIPHNGIDDDGNGYIDDYRGWNVYMNNDSMYDGPDEHGTHVAGIAAAKTNNGIGVAGVCWGCKVLAIDGSSTVESDVVKAYDYVIEMRRLYDQTSGAKGAFIVSTNSSFGVDQGHPADYPIWCALYDSMGRYGILSAAATANRNWNVDVTGDIPTQCPSKWMIAVTNTTINDTRNTGAGYGPVSIDLGAPGTSIKSTIPGNSYGNLSGCSMASPHVAGAIGAMWANACVDMVNDYMAYPDSIALIMRDYLFESVDPLSDLANLTTTGGRLNLYHAYMAERSYSCDRCPFSVQKIAQTDVRCHGDSSGSIQTTVSGGPGNSYHAVWSNGDSGTVLAQVPAGFYQLTVSDSGGCQRVLTAAVHQPAAIHINSINVVPLAGPANGNVVINASAGTDTLYYQMNGGAIQSGDIFVIDTPGLYQFRVLNATGCFIDTFIGVYYTGIAESSDISYLTLSPNPTSGTATLLIRSERAREAQYVLTDMTGKEIERHAINIRSGLQKEYIDLTAPSDGIYLLSLTDGSHTLRSVRVSVIH
ncbi:MAG: S8 family serine peptidase [Bacteroidetes bacterium]|nr:S8 family serine peptidase [Bacteroidota bacterium]